MVLACDLTLESCVGAQRRRPRALSYEATKLCDYSVRCWLLRLLSSLTRQLGEHVLGSGHAGQSAAVDRGGLQLLALGDLQRNTGKGTMITIIGESEEPDSTSCVKAHALDRRQSQIKYCILGTGWKGQEMEKSEEPSSISEEEEEASSSSTSCLLLKALHEAPERGLGVGRLVFFVEIACMSKIEERSKGRREKSSSERRRKAGSTTQEESTAGRRQEPTRSATQTKSREGSFFPHHHRCRLRRCCFRRRGAAWSSSFSPWSRREVKTGLPDQ